MLHKALLFGLMAFAVALVVFVLLKQGWHWKRPACRSSIMC